MNSCFLDPDFFVCALFVCFLLISINEVYEAEQQVHFGTVSPIGKADRCNVLGTCDEAINDGLRNVYPVYVCV